MHDNSLSDQQLQSLEARLAAMSPQISPEMLQQILYECAYSAGQRAATRQVWRWQVATLTCGVLLCALSLPAFNPQWKWAQRRKPFVPHEVPQLEKLDVAQQVPTEPKNSKNRVGCLAEKTDRITLAPSRSGWHDEPATTASPYDGRNDSATF